jgi:hypothetical protein
MRQRTLLDDTSQEGALPARDETYERVRRTVDEALAELQLPYIEKEDSGAIKVGTPSR